MGYTLLKWVHAACPDLLTELFNLSIDAGTHPWKTATVVAINKPNKLDYSQPKAYRPISLLECTGKVLEKIVAKRFNCDIAQHNLLLMTQFGSWAQHCATDAVATLVHRIQATQAACHTGALLLFDILGFFDHINLLRATAILRNKGFPENVCMWTQSFLMGRTATLQARDYISDAFPILTGTPQGSPLSPILSALYTSTLLEHTKAWSHHDLTLYVDDGAIYATSATIKSAVDAARDGFIECLEWLSCNGLAINATKLELMVFSPDRAKQDLIGSTNIGLQYDDPTTGRHRLRAQPSLHYLGVYL
jgi:hypothetical protein